MIVTLLMDWAAVNRAFFKASKWFDNVVVDAIGVDGTGVAVNLFNLFLELFNLERFNSTSWCLLLS